ncbi:hypothetical protein [Rhodococcus sp. AQ5-07]|uniref:hypothetical protein n=1 Tax=Rhodococcus sp. AQ5-07 TaxID=2054902 RepID=UPI000DBFCBA0|nr:hypothetical protein [Rhodococcus sp. AQ5-07]RAL31803.1 hypothetical protein CVN56_27050 [Rhodococcus sp. AQ5-07]
MVFELRPYHVARALTVLFVIPVLWAFSVEGVTTTTEYDVATGETSSSSDFGSQLGGSIVWILLAVASGVAAWYLAKNRIAWPESIKAQLRQFKLAPPAADPNSTHP